MVPMNTTTRRRASSRSSSPTTDKLIRTRINATLDNLTRLMKAQACHDSKGTADIVGPLTSNDLELLSAVSDAILGADLVAGAKGDHLSLVAFFVANLLNEYKVRVAAKTVSV
jgi:hypothetical protein